MEVAAHLIGIESERRRSIISSRDETRRDTVVIMKATGQALAIGFPARGGFPEAGSSLCAFSTSYVSCKPKQNKTDLLIKWMNKFGRKADTCTQRIREHVRLGPKLAETVRGKLSSGARNLLQAGGVERAFKKLFTTTTDHDDDEQQEDGEKLLKAFQCHLSTSAGPIAGTLFISTRKVAFHSDRHLTFTSPHGEVLSRSHYKVVIPLRKIKRSTPCENVSKPAQKYIQIVTVDDFEFWFMGFLSCKRSFKYLQAALLQSPLKSLKKNTSIR